MSNTKSIPVSFRLTESEHAAIVKISGEDAAKSLSETVKSLVLEGLAGRLAEANNAGISEQIASLRELLLETQASQLGFLIDEFRQGRTKKDPEEHLRLCYQLGDLWRVKHDPNFVFIEE